MPSATSQIGDWLLGLRHGAALSRTRVANDLRISEKQLQRWEHGTAIRAEMFLRLVVYYRAQDELHAAITAKRHPWPSDVGVPVEPKRDRKQRPA